MLGDEGLAFAVRPSLPFRLDWCAWALRRRAENVVDRWDGTTYRRVVVLGGRAGEIAVRQTGSRRAPRLRVSVRGSHLDPETRLAVRALLDRTLGLRLGLGRFYGMAARDPHLGPLVTRFRGLRPPRFPTLFEALCNAIACQQFTLTVGIEMLNRLVRTCGRAVRSGGGLAYAFPEPEDVARLRPTRLRGLGFSGQKTRALITLSRALARGPRDLDTLESLDNAAARDRLLELYGVGRWTAEYVLLRGLGRLDVFPGDDVGARNHLARWLGRRAPLDYEGVRAAVGRWHPYAGFVYFHLLLQGLLNEGMLSVARRAPRRDPIREVPGW